MRRYQRLLGVEPPVSLSAALAGLLLAGSSHGYELHATLEGELGSSWLTRPAQVYLTLGRMQRDGLVTSERVRQETRPDRQRLTLTDAGRRAAEDWLAHGPADELVVRLAVARLVVPQRLPSLLDTMIDERTAALHRLRAARAGEAGGFRPEARDAEIRLVEGQLRWLSGLRSHLDEIVARPRVRQTDARAAELA